MPSIYEIDKNFKIETSINKDDIVFLNPLEEPFKVYGVYYEDGKYRRMPEAVAKTVSPGVHYLHSNTAGGRIRFRTNSPYVAINAKMPFIEKMSHFAMTGSVGFDLYVDGIYAHTYRPSFDIVDGYESVRDGLGDGMKEIVINMPLYSDVSEVYVGLKEGSDVEAPTPYKVEKPVVYYGSSVTQGGCASRAGTSYQGFVSRELDVNFINLGFSGNAYAEEPMYSYIKTLDMSVFVMDYDYNAVTVEYLDKTHERMFLAIREAQPELPIVLLTAPRAILSQHYRDRLEIIRRTYNNALARGDRNVYLIEGPKLMEICGQDGTVDDCHPTDFGFYSMAKAVSEVLKTILF